MERSKYRVTDAAGTHVAGKRVKAGDTLSLTEEEVRYPLISGVLEPVTAKGAERSDAAEGKLKKSSK